MPEGYTHVRCARAAAKLSGVEPAHAAAFAAGANGPDALFCFEAWKSGRRRRADLPKLGARMHEERTGAFLQSLVRRAATPLQKSYVLGFLCHYATDCTVHPYVVMITEPGQLYGKKGGHGYFEIALDSFLHAHDTGDAAVPSAHSCPHLTGAALAEVGALLQACIAETYGIQLTREVLADTFHHTYWLRRLFISRTGIKRALFWLLEPLFGGRGVITGHVSPARLRGSRPKDKRKLPAGWKNPFTGEQVGEGLPALLQKAERRSAAYMLGAEGYWQGKVTGPQLWELLGSAAYLSGLPDEQSSLGPARPL